MLITVSTDMISTVRLTTCVINAFTGKEILIAMIAAELLL